MGDFAQNHAGALACLGRVDEALQLADSSDHRPGGCQPTGPPPRSEGRPHGRPGDHRARFSSPRTTLRDSPHLHHTQYNIGATYALLGDTRQAVSWLKKASREGLPCYPLFERDPNLDSLREDPEFVAFMQQLKSQAEQFRSTL